MSRETPIEQTLAAPAHGAEERHIARGAILQQAATGVGVVVMLVVVTVLGRSLSLAEFGVYGLSISIAGYVLIVQYSVEAAAVRAIALAPDAPARDGAFTNAVAVYSGLGLVAGVLVALGGIGLAGVLAIPSALRDEAREAFVVLGAVIALGWPAKACQDALRAMQRFGLAALGEMAGYVVFGAAMVVLLAVDAPLWSLIGIGGSLSVLIGAVCLPMLLLVGDRPRLRPRMATRRTIRDLLGVATGLLIGSAAELFLYSSDRIILAAFRNAATVGLYEAAVRGHNLLRQMHGTLLITVAPVAAGYISSADDERLRELLLRGTRYVMAVVVPATVVMVTLAEPIIDVWLGDKFRPAAPALAILSSYWLVGASLGVAGGMLLAAGKIRELAQYAWLVACVNLALSLALTPWLGLEGVALGTTIPYLVLFPVFVRIVLRTFPMVSVRDLVHEAVVPAYTGAVLLAAALLAVRSVVNLDTIGAVGGAGMAGLALYWAGYYLVWLRPNERVLVRSFVRLPRAAVTGKRSSGSRDDPAL